MKDIKDCIPKTIDVIAPRAPAWKLIPVVALLVSVAGLMMLRSSHVERHERRNDG